MSGWQLSIIHC